jgi:hypothetical protein
MTFKKKGCTLTVKKAHPLEIRMGRVGGKAREFLKIN